MAIRTDKLQRFYCEPLACWISQVGCAARFRMAVDGNLRLRDSPCGQRCNVGRAVADGKPLPKRFELVQLKAPPTIASRDKAWGHATCLQCGKRFKRHSGNHRNFCVRRCAKRFARPWQPRPWSAADFEIVKEGNHHESEL